MKATDLSLIRRRFAQNLCLGTDDATAVLTELSAARRAIEEMRYTLQGLIMGHLSQCNDGTDTQCVCGAIQQNRRIRQTLATVDAILTHPEPTR